MNKRTEELKIRLDRVFGLDTAPAEISVCMECLPVSEEKRAGNPRGWCRNATPEELRGMENAIKETGLDREEVYQAIRRSVEPRFRPEVNKHFWLVGFGACLSFRQLYEVIDQMLAN